MKLRTKPYIIVSVCLMGSNRQPTCFLHCPQTPILQRYLPYAKGINVLTKGRNSLQVYLPRKPSVRFSSISHPQNARSWALGAYLCLQSLIEHYNIELISVGIDQVLNSNLSVYRLNLTVRIWPDNSRVIRRNTYKSSQVPKRVFELTFETLLAWSLILLLITFIDLAKGFPHRHTR